MSDSYKVGGHKIIFSLTEWYLYYGIFMLYCQLYIHFVKHRPYRLIDFDT